MHAVSINHCYADILENNIYSHIMVKRSMEYRQQFS